MSVGTVFPHVAAWLEHYRQTLKPLRVLEAGCGAGQYAPFFRDTQYVGFDIPETWYQIQNPPMVVASADDLPFVDQAFDLAFCVSAFDYFPNPQAVMNEMARCLRPGGVFLVFTYDRKTLEAIHRNCAALPASRATQGHHVFGRDELMAYGRRAGFDGTQLPYCPSMSLIQRAKLLLRPTNLRSFAFTRQAD